MSSFQAAAEAARKRREERAGYELARLDTAAADDLQQVWTFAVELYQQAMAKKLPIGRIHALRGILEGPMLKVLEARARAKDAREKRAFELERLLVEKERLKVEQERLKLQQEVAHAGMNADTATATSRPIIWGPPLTPAEAREIRAAVSEQGPEADGSDD